MRISKRDDSGAPARQIGFLPQLHGIELVAVENHLFPLAFELNPIREQLRVMKVIKVCVHGQCRLIHLTGKGSHTGEPPARGLSHTNNPNTGVLPALSPLHQKNLITSFRQRDTLLPKNPGIPRWVGAGHMADAFHAKNARILATIFSAECPSPKGLYAGSNTAIRDSLSKISSLLGPESWLQ